MSDTFSILQTMTAAQERGDAFALATIVRARGSAPRHAGTKMIVWENGRSQFTIGGGEMEARVVTEALAALADGKPRFVSYALVDPAEGDVGVCGGEVDVYIEPYLPPKTLFIIGCGHVGKALAAQGRLLGFRIVVTDDRPALATADNIPDADLYLPYDFADALAAFSPHRNCYVTAVTRNINVDLQILPQLAACSAAYIGVMGSRRRWAQTKEALAEQGMTEAEIGRFHSPIGLDIGAETPEEIAVAVLAEIVGLRDWKIDPQTEYSNDSSGRFY